MKLNLNNDVDVFTAGQLAGLQNARSVTAVIAEYIRHDTEEETQEVTITVAKALLPDTYKGNPSLFACKVLEKLNGEWLDSSGYQTPGKRTHVTIKILRDAKPLHARRANPLPSVKQLIKNWLDLNLSSRRKLLIPIAGIPAAYMARPEQLTYSIKREIQTPIKIVRGKALWIIKRA